MPTHPAPRARLDFERVAGWAAWPLVIAMVAWSAWHRWQVLVSSPYPVGIDGYSYAIQVRSLLERGHLAYPAAPLVFWLMAPVAWLSDPVFAVKLVAAAGGALAIVPAFLIGRRVGGLIGGLTAAVVVATSGGSFYLSLEFVKNGVGLTIALTAVWLGLRALERPVLGRTVPAAAAVIAAGLAHKMAALLAAALLVPALVVELRARKVPSGVWRALAVAAGGVVALVIVASLLAPSRVIGPRDLELLRGAFGHADWHLPAMATARANHRVDRLLLGDQGLVVLAIVVGFGLATTLLVEILPAPRAVRRADDAIAWAALALAAATCLPWLAVDQPDGLGFRLRVAAYAPAALVAAAAVGRATAALAAPWRLVVVVPMLVAWFWVQPAEPRDGMATAHPAMVAAMQAMAGRIPEGGVVITAERDLGFMAAWYARVPVRLRPEPVPPARRWRMIPLAMFGAGSPLDEALHAARKLDLPPPIGLHPAYENGLVLVPEATWEWILARLPEPSATRWRQWHTI